MNQKNYHIVVATDSFKGSMTSYEAGNAIATAIKEQIPGQVAVYPVADGGEGTTEALSFGKDEVQKQSIMVTGPLGKKVQAKYTIFGIGEEKTAVLEMAQAAGITLVPESQRNPLKTTTYGVGEMLLDAVHKGCKKLIVGIGGSATNDVGIGMLQALGGRFMDVNGNEVSYGAEGVENIAEIDTTGMPKELRDITIKVICDVNNPLVGEKGCSAVFAPQKGADPQMVQRMEQAITRFADLVEKNEDEGTVAREKGCDRKTIRVSNEAAVKECCDRWTAGAGAAGGLGYAFARFLRAELVRGIDLVLQEIHLEEAVQTADLVITGEGRMDAQTLMGKTPAGVAGLAKKYNVPVVAYAGCFGEGIEQCVESGLFDRVYAVTEKPGAFDPQMAVRDLGQKVQGTISEWFRMIDSESV